MIFATVEPTREEFSAGVKQNLILFPDMASVCCVPRSEKSTQSSALIYSSRAFGLCPQTLKTASKSDPIPYARLWEKSFSLNFQMVRTLFIYYEPQWNGLSCA